jgi:bile acid-coenzyme A ligase
MTVPLADVPGVYSGRSDPCLIYGAQRRSWRDLDHESDVWANELRERGVTPDDLVAFTLPNGPDFLAATFGIYKVGATPAPLSPKLPDAELREILQVMRPAAFMCDPPSSPRRVAGRVGPVSRSWKACTSGGSTGRPKVIVDHRPAAFDPEQTFIALPRDACVLVPGPLYHNAPFSAAVLALARGNRLAIMDRFDPEEALALAARERSTWALMVPTMMHRIWRLPAATRDKYDLSALECIVHTAAPMPEWLKRAWIEWLGPERIWEVYGATEGLARAWIGGAEWLERPGSVGRAIGDARFRIVDEQGREQPPGGIGEIYAMPPGGPGSTYHYIGAERRADPEGWESVGDIGWLDEAGYLFLADRRQDLIISGGVNIFPAEVEAALLLHPSVQSCAVVGIEDEDLGQAVHAVVQSDDPDLDCAQVREFLRDRLVATKHPRTLEVRAGPVRDDAGKVRKSTLTTGGSIHA